jgi:hypothetical protein
VSRNLLLAIGSDELRAGDRVLAAILNSDHPMVGRVVADALGSLPPGSNLDFRHFCAHIHGAVLAEMPAEPVEHLTPREALVELARQANALRTSGDAQRFTEQMDGSL